MKKLLSRMLSAVVAVLIVYGVRAAFDLVVVPRQIDKLAGTYVTEEQFDAADVEELLADYDFYTEEIALVDLDGLYINKYVQFTEDKTYTFYYDVDTFKARVEDMFRDAFADMYAGRSQLSAVYETDMAAMSEAEFQSFYAGLYNQATFEDLISILTRDAYNYSALEEDTEIGTFTIDDGKILCTIQGTYTAESMGYELKDGTLTLHFSNKDEVYTLCY